MSQNNNNLETEAALSIEEIYLRPAWRSQWMKLLLLLIASIGSFLVDNQWAHLALLFFGGYLALRVLHTRYSSSYMIGPKGVELTKGIVAQDYLRIEYRHIRGAHMHQSIMQRIFGLGQIKISTASADETLYMDDVKNPDKYTMIIKNRLMSLT